MGPSEREAPPVADGDAGDPAALAALSEYYRDEARISEGRIQSIDSQATAIASAIVALAAVTVAVVGDNSVDTNWVGPLVLGGIFGFVGLLMAGGARMPAPGRLSLRPTPVESRYYPLVSALEEAEHDLADHGANGTSAATFRLIGNVWAVRAQLMKQRADKKQSWLFAAMVCLFAAIVAPTVFVFDELLW